MAYAGPTVQAIGTTYTGALASSHDIPYPSGVTSGDWLILFLASSGHDETFTIPTGWRLCTAYNTNSAQGCAHEIMVRIADGTESGNRNIGTPALDGNIIGKMYRCSPGAVDSSADYSSGATSTYDFLSEPDPPNEVFPATDDWLVFASFVSDSATNVTTWPSGYSSTIEIDTTGVTMGISLIEKENVASENPGAMELSESARSGVAYTTALRKSTVALEDVIRPIADEVAYGWETAPTASQSLYAQVDEETASDTDYIYTDPVA